MNRLISRFSAFLRGDLRAAEGLGDSPTFPPVEWITAAGASDEGAAYALESAQRAAADATASTKSIQDKGASLLTITLALFPLAVAVTVLVTPAASGNGWASITAFVLLVVADVALAMAAVFAFLASGLILSGGWNPAKVPGNPSATVNQLKVAEADAWYFAAEVAMWSGRVKAGDLFTARRLIVAALLVAVLATPFLFIARGAVPPANNKGNHSCDQYHSREGQRGFHCDKAARLAWQMPQGT